MDKPAYKDTPLLFFDCETGALHPRDGDLLEIAWIKTDPTGKEVLSEACYKVLPTRPVDPRAAAVNGYTAEKWATEAVALDTVMPLLIDASRNATIVAHNVTFDWTFIEHTLRVRGQRWLGSYHKLCTMALAMPLVRAGLIPNAKLESAVSFFQVDPGQAHTALSDVRACRGVYLALMERYMRALLPQEPPQAVPQALPEKGEAA